MVVARVSIEALEKDVLDEMRASLKCCGRIVQIRANKPQRTRYGSCTVASLWELGEALVLLRMMSERVAEIPKRNK